MLNLCGAITLMALAWPGASASKLPPTADSFLIDSLPTLGGSFSPGFKQYSGFMPLGDAAGTHLFFWFVESQRDPATDPVRLPAKIFKAVAITQFSVASVQLKIDPCAPSSCFTGPTVVQDRPQLRMASGLNTDPFALPTTALPSSCTNTAGTRRPQFCTSSSLPASGSAGLRTRRITAPTMSKPRQIICCF